MGRKKKLKGSLSLLVSMISDKTPSAIPSLISSPSLSSSTPFFPRDLIWETDFREKHLILVKNVMLLTSVMNRPAGKSKLTAAPHSSLPDFVSREARDCFFSVFPLVSKGESNLIFCRDFHNLAGLCSGDLVIPFIIQKTLPYPFLSQNSSWMLLTTTNSIQPCFMHGHTFRHGAYSFWVFRSMLSRVP